MIKHEVEISWSRGDAPFTDAKYSRAHRWVFDGGAVVMATSSPSVVPLPYSDPVFVDPEEALVAAASSCHMLWFLSIAAGRGFTVDSYEDRAVGYMGRNGEGRIAMVRIALHPCIRFAGEGPDEAQVQEMHEASHDCCMIANSLRTEVKVEAPFKRP
ncbi:OsmC family protein [Mesoterricola sediminis]|uniref:Peroxiredoxin n=1 Tax=Mesoterricola sediminis TaxID=2927980 RepID=A0AA48GNP8_9BACT|nr:OsmC family protein [Mesoterricola sediminis]BDU76466.1 peroxiredoxin [Mesoterricola sediminis]